MSNLKLLTHKPLLSISFVLAIFFYTDAVMNAVTIQISHAVKYKKPTTTSISISRITKNIILGLPKDLVNVVI